MRQRPLDSTDSTYSSLFDRFSQEIRESHASVLSQDSLIDFGKSLRQVNIDQLSQRDKETAYSHYEPVNNILSSLQCKKLTIKNLRQNSSEYEIETLTYRQYWAMNDEYYQIINMLEPELLKDQNTLFTFYQHIKRTSLELRLISRHYIPELVNFECKEVTTEIKSKIFKSFLVLSDLFESLVSDVATLMENNIVVKKEVISRITDEAFACMDTASESFTYGIVLLSEVYDQSFETIFKVNGKKMFERVGINNVSSRNTDLLPHALLTRYRLRLSMFDSMLPFETADSSLRQAIKHCRNIQTKIDKEKDSYQAKTRLGQHKTWFTSNASQIISNLPLILLNTCILLPFVIVCWLIFSIQSLFSSSAHSGSLSR